MRVHLRLTRKKGSIRLSGERYGSVGIWTHLHYDGSAFSSHVRTFNGYTPRLEDFRVDPDSGQTEYMPPCGSDEERVEFHLEPLRRGFFKIKKVKEFREEIEKEDLYLVLVI